MESLKPKLVSGGLGAAGSISGLAASGCAGGQCAACLACAGVGIAALGAVLVMRARGTRNQNETQLEERDGLAQGRD